MNATNPEDEGTTLSVGDDTGGEPLTDAEVSNGIDTSENAFQMSDDDPRVTVESETDPNTPAIQANKRGAEFEGEGQKPEDQVPQDQEQATAQSQELQNMAARVEYFQAQMQQTQALMQETNQVIQQLRNENQQYRQFLQTMNQRAETWKQQQSAPQPPQPPPPDASFDVQLKYQNDLVRFETAQKLEAVQGELKGLKDWFVQGQRQAQQQAEEARMQATRAQFEQEYNTQLGNVLQSANYSFLKDKGFFDPATGQHVSRGKLYFQALYDAASQQLGRPADATKLAQDLGEWFKELGLRPTPAPKPGATIPQQNRTRQVVNARAEQQARAQQLKGVKPMGGVRSAPTNGKDMKALRNKFLPTADDARVVN